MPSGRKKRIMIACVTFETSKVVNPAIYYEINRMHIIHHVKNPASEEGKIYQAFYDRVVELLGERSPLDVEVVEHSDCSISSFSNMLSTVLSIIRGEMSREEGCEIYVNISSGSSEYTAASVIAAMMVPSAIPFSVGSRDFTVGTERIPDLYYIDGKPVGLTKATYDPRTLPRYVIEMPEEPLVRGLRILDERNNRGLSVTSGRMVEALKRENIWYRNTDSPDAKKSNQRQIEAVYYQRDYIAKWQRNGWIEKAEYPSRYVLTDTGRNIIETFYVD